jgi:hypothetical protein
MMMSAITRHDASNRYGWQRASLRIATAGALRALWLGFRQCCSLAPIQWHFKRRPLQPTVGIAHHAPSSVAIQRSGQHPGMPTGTHAHWSSRVVAHEGQQAPHSSAPSARYGRRRQLAEDASSPHSPTSPESSLRAPSRQAQDRHTGRRAGALGTPWVMHPHAQLLLLLLASSACAHRASGCAQKIHSCRCLSSPYLRGAAQVAQAHTCCCPSPSHCCCVPCR